MEQILAVRYQNQHQQKLTNQEAPMIYRSVHPLHRLANRYAQATKESAKYRIAANILETADSYHIQLFLAGFSRENIQIKLENNDLVISAKREKPQIEAKWISREVQYGEFERRFTLADTLQKEAIKAQFENGLLSLIIPKKAEEQARTIEIN